MRITPKGIGTGKVLLWLVLICFGIETSNAQYTDLINFTGTFGSYIGEHPFGSLILSGDTLYGTTDAGGVYGYGNIFSVQTNGTNYKDLVDFTGDTGSYIGSSPWGTLTLSGDTLYGMTYEGGINGEGNVFSVQTNGTNFKDLVDFTGTSGSYIGGIAYGSLILSDDTLYGMTYEGGINGYGNIFSVQTNGTNFTDLIDFTGTSGSYIGEAPQGSLTLSGGTLYGVTGQGGINGYGNIFSVQTNGTNFADLVDFTGTSGSYNGDYPGSLTLSGSTLYGMTDEGGMLGYGNIFSVQTNGTNFTDLVDFTGTSGSYSGFYPLGSLIISDNILYGMTNMGGINAYGNIFSVQTNGTNFKELVDFTGSSGSYIGWYPFGSLTLSGGTLYGMTNLEGAREDGNIFSFALLSVITSITNNISCNGGNNGSASVTESIGSPPYTYSWSPSGGTDSIANGLSAGTYTVIVTDSTGNVDSAFVTITQPSALTVSGTVRSNVRCNGGYNGSASVIISRGISPYTYLWNDASSQTTIAASGLSAGIYSVTVSDSCGSSATVSITITQPPPITVNTIVTNNVSCYGDSNGLAKAGAGNGIAPFTYSWSPNNSFTYIAAGLSAGVYIVTATDSRGCSATAQATVTQPPTLMDSVSSIIYAACAGETGSATIGVKGGTLPYTYTWSPPVSSTATAIGLTVRGYVVVVKDAHGCNSSLTFSITQPSAILISADSITDNGHCSGTIWALVSGGTIPYSYLWTGGLTTDTITNQCAGFYCCTLTDANGCMDSVCVAMTSATGINEEKAESEKVKVYPNPNNGAFTIQLSIVNGQSLVEIYNVLGQTVKSEELRVMNTEIDLSPEPSGIYLYRLIEEDGSLVGEGKIIIER